MLAAQQKWFNELYGNPLYLMAILLHPKYRKDFLEGVLRKAFNEHYDSKSIFEKLRTLWMEWASEYDYVQRQKGQSSEGQQTRRRTLIKGAKQVTIDYMAQKILGLGSMLTMRMSLIGSYASLLHKMILLLNGGCILLGRNSGPDYLSLRYHYSRSHQ